MIRRTAVGTRPKEAHEHDLFDARTRGSLDVAAAMNVARSATPSVGCSTPSAVAISPQGKISSPLVAGVDNVRALVERAAAGELPSQRWVPVGLNGGQAQPHEHAHQAPAPPPCTASNCLTRANRIASTLALTAGVDRIPGDAI